MDLKNNTTNALINDIEKLREHCQLSKWIVCSGSWGATLALLYAHVHPECVRALLLRSVFLGRPEDIKWFVQIGMPKIYPDYWRQFLALFTTEEQTDLIKASYRRLLGENELIRVVTAKARSTLQAKCASFEPNRFIITDCQQSLIATSFVMVQCHYMINGYFLGPNQMLKNIKMIKDIPGMIIHGHYDIST